MDEAQSHCPSSKSLFHNTADIFKGKNIKLTSTDPLDPLAVKTTIIDGKTSGPVVTFLGAEKASCVLAGFTIRNGKAQSGYNRRAFVAAIAGRAAKEGIDGENLPDISP